jgi:putative methionine-R-sulfoxide reductase with GAF domain
MAEDLLIVKGSKEEQYANLLPQIESLLFGENDLVANLANVAANKALMVDGKLSNDTVAICAGIYCGLDITSLPYN